LAQAELEKMPVITYDAAFQTGLIHILHQYIKTSESVGVRVPTRGTPTD
jgi:hypothetical protein